MEHMPKLAEILLDVPLDGRQFLLRIDLGNTGFLILGGFTVRAVLTVIIRPMTPRRSLGSSDLPAGRRRGCG